MTLREKILKSVEALMKQVISLISKVFLSGLLKVVLILRY